MAELSLRKISKVYPGGVVAVRELDLEIADRDFIVLVGPSGCGKSTTLRMIAGLEEITAGELLMDGERINERLPKDRDMAMVFQNYALYPHMSVYDNIAFGLKVRKTPKAEIRRRVEEAAQMLEIGDLLKRKPRAISGGERQRVAFARAIVRKPKVFLLDEPLSNLDAALRDQIRAELIALHQRLQATFVYVTHDQTEAMTLGTRIVIMRDGIVQQVDAPAHIYNNPQNIFVAGFIGSPRMNLLTAVLKISGRQAALHWEGHIIPLPAEKCADLAQKGYREGPVTLGIRPEHITLRPAGGQPQPQEFAAMKEIVELRGADSLLHLRCGESMLTARLESAAARELEQQCYVSLMPEKLHLFDINSGEAL